LPQNFHKPNQTQEKTKNQAFLEKLPQFFQGTEEAGKASGDSQKRTDTGPLKGLYFTLYKKVHKFKDFYTFCKFYQIFIKNRHFYECYSFLNKGRINLKNLYFLVSLSQKLLKSSKTPTDQYPQKTKPHHFRTIQHHQKTMDCCRQQFVGATAHKSAHKTTRRNNPSK
jgi:hypothetical protein